LSCGITGGADWRSQNRAIRIIFEILSVSSAASDCLTNACLVETYLKIISYSHWSLAYTFIGI